MSAEFTVNGKPFLQRQLAWDLVEHEESPVLMQNMGLIPGSDDVLLHEHMDSHLRAAKAAPVVEVATHLAGFVHEILTTYLRSKNQGVPSPEDLRKQELIVKSVTLATIQTLIAEGVLVINSERNRNRV